MDYPRLREPLISVICAGLCFILAWKIDRLPDWLRLFLVFMGVVFSSVAIVTALDFMAHKTSIRLREIQSARIWGAERLALALKGLTMAQTDMVQRQMELAVVGIPGDGGPAWLIRGMSTDVPLAYCVDFFEWSKQTAPYLFPVRRGSEVGGGDGWSNGVQYAQEITRSVIANGWGKPASGPYAAILTDDLPVVASKYGVSL